MKNSYATVSDNDGVNYREIANTMTEIGFKMNHSSARNYVLRVMKKFGKAITNEWEIKVSDEDLDRICKSSQFQQGICEILQTLEGFSSNRK